MDALGPEKESLEEKIGKLITEQTLKEEYVTLKSSEDRWLASGMIFQSHQAKSSRKSLPSTTQPYAVRFGPRGNFLSLGPISVPSNVWMPLRTRTR